MLRQILAVAAGIVVFLAIVAALDGLASVLFPLPPSIDPNNPDVFRDYMANLPTGALVIVLLGSTLAAFAGTYVSGILVGGGAWYWPYVTGAIGLVATLWNALSLPHPLWFVVAAPLGALTSVGLRPALWTYSVLFARGSISFCSTPST